MKDIRIDNTDARTFATRNTGWRFTDDNSEYVEQKLRIRLQTNEGEWYLNNRLGIPYYDEILGVKNPNLDFISDLYKAEIISIPEVEEITSFQLDYNNSERKLTVTFTARIISGEEVEVTI